MSREWDVYVQDTFKASPRLTLNYGVRYMYQTAGLTRTMMRPSLGPCNNKLIFQENSSTLTASAEGRSRGLCRLSL